MAQVKETRREECCTIPSVTKSRIRHKQMGPQERSTLSIVQRMCFNVFELQESLSYVFSRPTTRILPVCQTIIFRLLDKYCCKTLWYLLSMLDVLTSLSDCRHETVERIMERRISGGSYMCWMDFHNAILCCGFLCAQGRFKRGEFFANIASKCLEPRGGRY